MFPINVFLFTILKTLRKQNLLPGNQKMFLNKLKKNEYILGAHTVFPRLPSFPMHLFPSMKRRFTQLALRCDTDYKIAI